ncbi:MAG: efflux RND transporter periplasmic adaptor subunit [Nocardioides sp.]|uniref:efflux RND transporter periplasmic adaptor subunit n=1 Tax=Nocardioides sp. TaxID=35761 RepID=UPI0039E2B0E3
MRWIRKKWWITLVVILVLAASGGGWLWLRDDSSASASTTTTATVTSETVKQTVSASGTLSPAKTADLDFEVSGTVTAVLVEEGDKVTKGQALAEIDSSSLVATRTAAVAQLEAAESQLDDDEDDDASDVQIASDKANIVSAQASVDAADEDVENATLRATISGTVTALDLEVGDSVGSSGSGSSSSSSSSSTTSSSAVSIVNSGTWLVDATVASADIDSVKKGLQAELTVTGVDETVYGTVQSVGLVAETNSSGAAVFPVTIKVTGKRTDLFSGVSVTASIVVKQTDDVISVVSRALQTDGDETYVMKVVDGKAVKQVVTVGDTNGNTTAITSGLAEGDVVQVPGFSMPAGGGSGSGDSDQQQMPDMGDMSNFQPPSGMTGGQGGFGGGGS